jgi:hypothetical protein
LEAPEKRLPWVFAEPLPSPVFAVFEHVLDGGLVDHQIRGAAPVQLDAILVVPLDITVDFFAVTQDDYHGGLRLHLLLIVEVFGVGLFAGHKLLVWDGGTVAASVSFSAFGGRVIVAVIIVGVIGAIKGWADQLAIRKAFLLVDMTGGLFGWYGF